MVKVAALVLAAGQWTAAAQHVRGAADPERVRRDGEPTRRVLAVLDYAIKGEEEYSHCPKGYPAFGRLGDLLEAWNPDQPDVPEHGVMERLKVLNYSDPTQLAMAETLRDCEVPFKLIGVPELEAASRKWTDEYLEEKMAPCSRCNVMKSDSNRFMFWHRKGKGTPDAWEPPTSPLFMPYSKWREWTREADAAKIGPSDVHYYLTTGVAASTKTPPATGEFVADDLPIFSTKTDNFFIPDVDHQKGIQCRFGARGIIAESHFDHGKNFVAMLRGRKRYLLNPPAACPSLGIISELSHPSYRHSRVDWSAEPDWPPGFADAPALETVLEAGELLYIPSFWYHYIVSEGFNVQCNARSGLSLRQEWKDQTDQCMGRELSAAPPENQQLKKRIENKAGGGFRGHLARGGAPGRGGTARRRGGRLGGRPMNGNGRVVK